MTRTPEQILCCPCGCIHTPDYCAAYGDGVEDLRRFHSMTTPDRLTLARALLPDGWVVAKVPDRATPETVPWRYGDEWVGVQDGASEESLDLICNGFADGWNACRAAMLASSEETP